MTLLYAFLAVTAALAVASLAVLGAGVCRGLGPALFLFVAGWLAGNAVLAYGVHRTAYALESRDPFCVSCHLHDAEFARFRDEASPVALDLAGYHRRHGKLFTCITCHVGEGVGGRANVLFFAGMDVVHYTLGRFRREFEGMRHPLDDATCAKCHAPGDIGGFHRSKAHAGHTRACLSCHLAHARTDQAFGFIDYRRWRPALLEPCLGCHPALRG